MQVFAEIVMATDASVLEGKMSEYHAEVNRIWDALMGYEMQLVDQLEETIKDFERNLADMMTTFVEYVQGLYPLQCQITIVKLFMTCPLPNRVILM